MLYVSTVERTMKNIFVGAPMKVVNGVYAGYTGRVLEYDAESVVVMEDCHMPENDYNNSLNCEWRDNSECHYESSVRVKRDSVNFMDWSKAPSGPTFKTLYYGLGEEILKREKEQRKMPVITHCDLDIVLNIQRLVSFIRGWKVAPNNRILIKTFWLQYMCVFSPQKKKPKSVTKKC